MSGRIIRNNRTLFDKYHDLQSGDIVVGRIRMRPSEEHLLVDLQARKVCMIPSACSQLCSRSKVFQTRLLAPYMIPGTRAIYDQHDLMEAVTEYAARKHTEVICKLDRANGGQGVLRFSHIEDVFNHATLGTLTFPFVLQPFISDCFDVRAVFLGETIEAYKRYNPNNFRHNLHCGGASTPYQLGADQLELCRQVMTRAQFPYAHIDLLITESGETRLTEINLRGGLRGAVLNQKDYLRLTGEIHEQLLQNQLKLNSPPAASGR